MMTKATTDSWFHIDNVDQLDSPALVVFPERVKENIRLLKTIVNDVELLRPHAKTHKTKEATQLMIKSGIHKFKCTTIAEAEMLALSGADDVLLAYQPFGPKLSRLAELVKKYPETSFSCLVDNEAAAEEISAKFELLNLNLGVYIDLDVGQHRTGIPPGESALQLYLHCCQLGGIRVKGLHAYDGHINDKDFEVRTKRCNDTFIAVQAMRETLQQKGYRNCAVVAGGSPTFPVHAKRKNVECSPGTFVFWDKGYSDQCAEQPFAPAAVLVTRVISLPG